MNSTARIIEVFASIQGEGIYVGQPHLFVRFWDCNLACHYCDTDYRGPYVEVTGQELLKLVEGYRMREGPFHAVSLTGGEPLLWWQFLKGWLPELKRLNQRTYLETNGTLTSALHELMPWIDIVAMDIKPPSATSDRACWREHANFLRVAHAGRQTPSGFFRPELFVKIVVTRQITEEDLQASVNLVSGVDPTIPVVLQPVTPWGSVKEGPLPEQLESWRKQAFTKLTDVRIIPQVHRILGVR